MRHVAVTLIFAALPALAASDALFARQMPPGITMTATPPYGAIGLLQGRVTGVRPRDFRVLVFVRVQEAWWGPKPTFEAQVPIGGDGTWVTMANGRADHLATRFAAYVVPAAFHSSRADGTREIPTDVGRAAVASVIVNQEPATKTLTWSNRQWRIKDSGGLRLGPGPNQFSDSPKSVFVDAASRLHLRITRQFGEWTSAEIWLTRSLGYGTYSFTIESGAMAIGSETVFGAFLWDEAAEHLGYREIDFLEISRWGDPNGPNAQFVVQPHTLPDHRFRYSLTSRPVQLAATWSLGRVAFTATPAGRTTPVSWTFEGNDVPTAGFERVHLVLWQRNAPAPAGARDVDVTVRAFTFQPRTGAAK